MTFPKDEKAKPFPSAGQDARRAQRHVKSPQTLSPSYRLAYLDDEFMLREDLRPIRLQLELMKPELLQREHNIVSTIVIFGSARIPDEATARQLLEDVQAAAAELPDQHGLKAELKAAERAMSRAHYYEEARRLAAMISAKYQTDDLCRLVVVTGGGPGIMEAANRGACESGKKSIGLNIVLPHEQAPNTYITPELCFQFHYFAVRKMHFLIRARALVAFPGGFGTMDELFETLTLIQTRKIVPVPVILFGREYWSRIINLEAMAEEGMISQADLALVHYADTAEDAMVLIEAMADTDGDGYPDWGGEGET